MTALSALGQESRARKSGIFCRLFAAWSMREGA
jgi:hypothetical protein